MTTPLEFFYDVGSPYSYLAARRLTRDAPGLGIQIIWRPMLLGAVFKATGNTMPARVPARARYMLKDLLRWSRRENLPFTFSRFFPISSLNPMRVVAGFPDKDQPKIAKSIFKAYWVDDRNISDPEVLEDLVGAEALKRSQEQWVKDRLRASTDDAVDRGAFGAPTLFVGDQMYFGNDRVDFALAAAGG
jgi:2-hydroxychromene-2-carboxylate isomerase